MRLKIIFLVILTLACSERTLRRLDIKPISQKVIFQHAHFANIEGDQYRGWFVDKEGMIRAYDIKPGEGWIPVEQSGKDSGYISLEALLVDYRLATRPIIQVPMLELQRYYDLLPKAAQGKLSESVHAGNDEPVSSIVGYLWDTQKGKFKAVLIDQTGDWERKNLSLEAGTLTEWLNGLDMIYQDSLLTKADRRRFGW
jgi:hypothetical protein